MRRIQVADCIQLQFTHTSTKLLNVSHKSKHSTLGCWYSTARVSKRPSNKSAACSRARYCIDLMCSDSEESLRTTRTGDGYPETLCNGGAGCRDYLLTIKL